MTNSIEQIIGPALTYASHIADCAERYAAASDRFEIADEKVAAADTQAEEEQAQDEREEAAHDMREHRRAMQNAIYEYRKRLPDVRAALTKEPRAWAAFAPNGNCRIWFGDRASAERWNERYNTPGAELSPLYEFGCASPATVKESLTVEENQTHAHSTDAPA